MTDLPLPGQVPPAPPPPPPEGWRAAVPVSGKAVASLVCGVAGLVICFLFSLVGLVLGAIAIGETGRDGVRRGRGMAVGGTVVSLVGLLVNVAIVGFVFGVLPGMMEDRLEIDQEAVSRDAERIIQRLQRYHSANGNSLGPGGPVLALAPAQSETVVERRPGEHYEADMIPDTKDGRVTGRLTLRHLFRFGELEHAPGLERWRLTITSRDRATLQAVTWGGEVAREYQVTDAGKGRYIEVPGSTNR